MGRKDSDKPENGYKIPQKKMTPIKNAANWKRSTVLDKVYCVLCLCWRCSRGDYRLVDLVF